MIKETNLKYFSKLLIHFILMSICLTFLIEFIFDLTIISSPILWSAIGIFLGSAIGTFILTYLAIGIYNTVKNIKQRDRENIELVELENRLNELEKTLTLEIQKDYKEGRLEDAITKYKKNLTPSELEDFKKQSVRSITEKNIAKLKNKIKYTDEGRKKKIEKVNKAKESIQLISNEIHEIQKDKKYLNIKQEISDMEEWILKKSNSLDKIDQEIKTFEENYRKNESEIKKITEDKQCTVFLYITGIKEALYKIKACERRIESYKSNAQSDYKDYDRHVYWQAFKMRQSKNKQKIEGDNELIIKEQHIEDFRELIKKYQEEIQEYRGSMQEILKISDDNKIFKEIEGMSKELYNYIEFIYFNHHKKTKQPEITNEDKASYDNITKLINQSIQNQMNEIKEEAKINTRKKLEDKRLQDTEWKEIFEGKFKKLKEEFDQSNHSKNLQELSSRLQELNKEQLKQEKEIDILTKQINAFSNIKYSEETIDQEELNKEMNSKIENSLKFEMEKIDKLKKNHPRNEVNDIYKEYPEMQDLNVQNYLKKMMIDNPSIQQYLGYNSLLPCFKKAQKKFDQGVRKNKINVKEIEEKANQIRNRVREKIEKGKKSQKITNIEQANIKQANIKQDIDFEIFMKIRTINEYEEKINSSSNSNIILNSFLPREVFGKIDEVAEILKR